MGAKVIILAKSLIPNLLRACAIVHCVTKHLHKLFISQLMFCALWIFSKLFLFTRWLPNWLLSSCMLPTRLLPTRLLPTRLLTNAVDRWLPGANLQLFHPHLPLLFTGHLLLLEVVQVVEQPLPLHQIVQVLNDAIPLIVEGYITIFDLWGRKKYLSNTWEREGHTTRYYLCGRKSYLSGLLRSFLTKMSSSYKEPT